MECKWPDEECIHGEPDPIGRHMADEAGENYETLPATDSPATDSPLSKVAALSADLREYTEDSGWKADDLGREGLTVALLDAVDALLLATANRQAVYDAAYHVLANMEYDEGTPADVLADHIATRATK